MNTIKIKGQDYKVKYTIRALFIYERLFGKTFTMSTAEESFQFFYSMLKANNSDMKFSYDDFIDYIDEDPTIANQFAEVLNAQVAQKVELGEKGNGKGKGSKKK